MKKQIYLSILLSFLFINIAIGQTLEDDRQSLVALYSASDGANWNNNTGWLIPGTPGDNPCGWFGVGCTGGRVSHIDLTDNNLDGIIPPEIGDLSALISFVVRTNNLGGTIPPEIGQLTNLQTLWLRYNDLTGSIPIEIGNLLELRTLTLGSNDLIGNIPPELGALTKLHTLLLERNNLDGAIPNTLANLIDLVNFNLEDNNLTGSIPSWLGSLSDLEVIWFGNNQFSGNIPPEIGMLSNLRDLNLENNLITGSIPPEIGDLTSLIRLFLRGNMLVGSIPVEIGNLSNLEILWLQFNQLSGSIPNSITNLSSLTYLHLRNNMLSGSIPSSINNLTNLQFLWIGGNPLTGQLPTELGMLPNLEMMRIAFCSLDGPIPTSFQNLSNLTTVDLRNNMLSGNIPSGLANISTLHTLALEDNQLSGPIPDFSGIPGLNTLWLRFNRFTFEGVEENLFVPNYLYNSQALIPIYLTGNELSVSAGGTICNSTYYWYKVGTGLVATVNNCTETYIPGVPGDYYVQVTNSGIPNFTLTSEIATVTCIPELCDGIDNDCDGLIDEDFDLDGDGVTSCGGDCDDNDPNNFPGNIEVCDGKDNNCDGNIDDSIDPDPIASLYNLISIVQSMGLSQKDEEKLTDKLNNAITKLNSGNEGGAIGSINGFIGQVGAFIMNGRLTQIEGDLLIDIANCIISSINNNQNYYSPAENAIVSNKISRVEFEVFPNPANNYLNIDLHNYLDQEISISIYSHLGQQVWSLPRQKLENPIMKIKLDNYQLPEGIYLLSVRTAEGRQAKQFVISK